jgi:hypothetical protein
LKYRYRTPILANLANPTKRTKQQGQLQMTNCNVDRNSNCHLSDMNEVDKELQATATAYKQLIKWEDSAGVSRKHKTIGGTIDDIGTALILRIIAKLLTDPEENVVLDIGIGDGEFVFIAASAGLRVSGYDIEDCLEDHVDAKKEQMTEAQLLCSSDHVLTCNFRTLDGFLVSITNLPEAIYCFGQGFTTAALTELVCTAARYEVPVVCLVLHAEVNVVSLFNDKYDRVVELPVYSEGDEFVAHVMCHKTAPGGVDSMRKRVSSANTPLNLSTLQNAKHILTNMLNDAKAADDDEEESSSEDVTDSEEASPRVHRPRASKTVAGEKIQATINAERGTSGNHMQLQEVVKVCFSSTVGFKLVATQYVKPDTRFKLNALVQVTPDQALELQAQKDGACLIKITPAGAEEKWYTYDPVDKALVHGRLLDETCQGHLLEMGANGTAMWPLINSTIINAERNVIIRLDKDQHPMLVTEDGIGKGDDVCLFYDWSNHAQKNQTNSPSEFPTDIIKKLKSNPPNRGRNLQTPDFPTARILRLRAEVDLEAAEDRAVEAVEDSDSDYEATDE